MGTDILKLCGVAVLCAVAGAIVGKLIGGIGVALRLAGLCTVLGGSLVILHSLVGELSQLYVDPSVADYASLMLKALAVCVLCRICSDVCRDCGESTLGGAVESAGKLTLVLLSVPALREIVEYAKTLIDKF